MELKLALNVHQCSLLTPLSAVNVLQIVIPVAIQLLHVQHVQLAISSMEAICVQNVQLEIHQTLLNAFNAFQIVRLVQIQLHHVHNVLLAISSIHLAHVHYVQLEQLHLCLSVNNA